MEAGAGTPRAAGRRLRSVQGADPGQHRWQAQPLAGVRREPYAEPSSLKSRPARCKNADGSNQGHGRKGTRIHTVPFTSPAEEEHKQGRATWQPQGSLAEHEARPQRGPAVHSCTPRWDHISSGELRRNSPANAQQEMTMDHNTMGLPGCLAYTRRAAAASSTAPGWD